MTIQQMRYYAMVGQLQNITQAASRLHVAQSTLSQAMQLLERETGMNLFHHEGRRIILTPDGRRLYARVCRMLLHVDHFEDDVREMARSRNHVRLAVPPQLATQIMPKLLGRFCLLHPEIELEIVEPGGAEAARMVQEEDVDLAVLNLDEEKQPALSYHRLGLRPICLAVWPEHLLAGRKQVTFREAAEEPLVMLNQNFFVTRKILREFGRRGLEPDVRYYSENLSTIVSLLQHHVAVGILSTQALTAQGDLHLIPFDEPQNLMTCIATKKGRQIYQDQRLLIRFLKQEG